MRIRPGPRNHRKAGRKLIKEPVVTGYLIAQIEVTDPDAFEAYRTVVPAVIAKFGVSMSRLNTRTSSRCASPHQRVWLLLSRVFRLPV